MKLMRNKTSLLAWLALLAAMLPRASFACAACYGDPSSAMSHGLTWAITFMVGMVFFVLTGITVFFVRMNKKTPPDGRVELDDTTI